MSCIVPAFDTGVSSVPELLKVTRLSAVLNEKKQEYAIWLSLVALVSYYLGTGAQEALLWPATVCGRGHWISRKTRHRCLGSGGAAAMALRAACSGIANKRLQTNYLGTLPRFWITTWQG